MHLRRLRHRDAGARLTLDADAVLALDAADPLAAFAEAFHHPVDVNGRRQRYLCGHSLGLQPKRAAQFLAEELREWQRLGVQGHHHATRPWIEYHDLAAQGLAELVGAAPAEVVAMNSLTINLHLMMVSFYRPRGVRTKILMERSAFPSDRHAVTSHLVFHGLDPSQHLIEVEPRPGELALRTEDVIARLDLEAAHLALVLLPGVQYLTGQCLELEPLIAAARGGGACVGVDLAHAVGNTLLRLHDWQADFAVWCSYKYLNAGPGAIGGCFVHERHACSPALPRFAGWWGHDKHSRFSFGPDFDPIPGAQGWQVSNPPILSTAPLLASLEIFRSAGMPALRAKSIALTKLLQELIQQLLPAAVHIITPLHPSQRGNQLSVRLPCAPQSSGEFARRLTDAGVIADWREPDVLRLAPVPLYNSFGDVFAAVDALARLLKT